MYRAQYFCPREAPVWQDLTDSFLGLFRQPQVFRTLDDAVRVVNALVWRYHSARVIDPAGNVVYQV